MATHTSATLREDTPHVIEAPQRIETCRLIETPDETSHIPISDALRRRAQAVIYDRSIDPQWRTVIRYGLETNDPWLPDLVRRADAGESIVEVFDISQSHEIDKRDESLETYERHTHEEKIEALAELICRSGDEPETKSGALLVLMATLENSSHPKLLANTAKHFAFTRSAELNLYGMVDVHVAAVEAELFSS